MYNIAEEGLALCEAKQYAETSVEGHGALEASLALLAPTAHFFHRSVRNAIFTRFVIPRKLLTSIGPKCHRHSIVGQVLSLNSYCREVGLRTVPRLHQQCEKQRFRTPALSALMTE